MVKFMFLLCDHDKQTLKNNFNKKILLKKYSNGHNLNFKKDNRYVND